MILYFTHLLFSRFGSKLTSLTLVFMLMRQWPHRSLSLSVVLFAVGAFCTILFAPLYRKVIRRFPAPAMVFFFDLAIGLLVAVFIFVHTRLWLCLGLYVLLEILWGLRGLYDRAYFFLITKDRPFETQAYQWRGSALSVLSMVLPAAAAALIARFDVPDALWGDTACCAVAGTLWLFCREALRKRAQDRGLRASLVKENEPNRPLASNPGFFAYIKTLPPSLKTACLFMIVVGFISEFENPLIFNYLGLERGFSEAQIGLVFSLFSAGMTLGGWLYTYIPEKPVMLLVFITLDALFSFMLSLPLPFGAVAAAYTLQGVAAMFMMIAFDVLTQKSFAGEEEFLHFNIAYNRTSSLITLLSYAGGFVLTLVLQSGAVMFRIMALTELGACWFFWFHAHPQKAHPEKTDCRS